MVTGCETQLIESLVAKAVKVQKLKRSVANRKQLAKIGEQDKEGEGVSKSEQNEVDTSDRDWKPFQKKTLAIARKDGKAGGEISFVFDLL